MKKVIKSIFLILFATVAISIFSKVEAASATITANKTTVTVGDSVKVTVTIKAAAWNINVSGSASGSIVGFNSDAENQTTTKTYSIDTSKAGTYKVSISGDITDASATTPDTISKSVSITVKAKSNSNSNSGSNTGTTTKPTTPTTTAPKFTSVNETVYATDDGINVRKSYSTSSAAIGSLKKGESLKRTGIATTKTSDGIKWSKVTYNGTTAYVSSSYLTKTKPAEEKPKTEEPKDNTTTNQNTNNEVSNAEVTNNTNTEEPVNNVDNSNVSSTNEDLGLSKLEIAGVNFSEGFDSSIHSYTLKLNFFVKDLNITAEANKADAKVEIIGNENFEEGENNVTILVSSADNKEVATYQIKVTIPSEVAGSPQNNIQFYLMCGTIILAAIVVIVIIISIYKKKNRNEVNYKDSNFKANDDILDPYTDMKPKKERVKSGKHSN